MQGHDIRQHLHDGRRVYGTHVCSLTNPLTAHMQATLEYDFVFICNEHMPIDRTETAMMCRFYAARGMSPIVRIPRAYPHYATMALDGGAQGIVAPYVETEDEVRAMVGAVKYRPVKGKKLERYLSGQAAPSPKMADFLERFNRENYLIIGIESVAAHENLDRLISIPGVDGVFVGPHDLTTSMDIPEEYGHPEFVAVVDDIIRRCRQAGIGVGVHFSQTVTSDQRYRELLEKGANWMLYGADIALLVSEMRKRLRSFRDHMGDSYEAGEGADGSVQSCLTETADQQDAPDSEGAAAETSERG